MSDAHRDRAKPALVLLAAGGSRRLGQCKALAAITPRNPLELLSEAGAAFDDSPPLVVTGADHAAIAAALPGGLEILFNPDWSSSRSSGVRAAARARPGRDLCVAPVDVPLVPREVFDALLAAWRARASPPRGWLAPRVVRDPGSEKDSHGHPIVMGRDLALELDAMPAAASLRDLRARAAPIFSIAVASRAIVDDLDTPEDLARLRARAGL
jgi:CTP:molybdopterin cytidylyltransferase MocA